MANIPGGSPPPDLDLAERKYSLLRADVLQHVRCGAHGIAVRAFAELGLFAEADEQHALGLDPVDGAQQQRRAEPAGEVAQREDALQCAARCAIGRLSRARQLVCAVRSLIDAEHQAAGLSRLGCAASYAKFHCESPYVSGRKYRMIFHRSLLREFANLAVAVFLTLFLIAVTTRLIRLLGQAAGGKLPSDAVIAFFGFFSLT